METVELKGEKRELKTKGELRQLRLAGRLPAVIYGGRKDSYPLTVNAKEFAALLKEHGSNVLVNLLVGSDKETVLMKEGQRDVLTRQFIHLDFQRISLKDKIEVNVPLRVVGEAPGVKQSGGILEHILRDLRVRCLPADIPHAIDVDVSALQLNQGLRVKDLKLSEGVEALMEAEHLVVNIVAPMKEEVVAPVAAAAVPGAAAEPEVIAKGKKPEEGAEGAAAPAKDAKAAPAKDAGKEAKK